jgi:hypothetical protein
VYMCVCVCVCVCNCVLARARALGCLRGHVVCPWRAGGGEVVVMLQEHKVKSLAQGSLDAANVSSVNVDAYAARFQAFVAASVR